MPIEPAFGVAPPERSAARAPGSTARDLLLIVALTAPLLWLGLGNHHFWLADEPFVAEVAREMHASGDFLVPRLNGEPFLEKPPLHYAAVALSFRLFGVTPLAARLPSALAGLLTVCLTYVLGRRLFGRRAAIMGALLLPTFFLTYYVAHYCLVDATLVLCVTGAFAAGAYAFGEDARPWAAPAVYAAAALAFLAKGFVGPLMIALGFLAFVVMRGARTTVRPARHVLGLAAVVAVVAAWAAALERAGGAAFVREALLANSIGRIFPIAGLVPRHDTLATHATSGYALLLGLMGNVAPWTPAVLWLLIPARLRGAPAATATAWGRRFLGTIVIADLVALALAHNKRGMYLLPLYPLMALLIASEADRIGRRDSPLSRAGRWALGIQATVVGLMAIGTALVPLLLRRYAPSGPAGAIDGWLTGSLVVTVLVAMAAAVLSALRRAPRLLMTTIWAETVVCLAFAAIVLFPRLDAQKSFARFFDAAKAVTDQRGAVPILVLHNEASIGLAALTYGRCLPVVTEPAALRKMLLASPDLYVIAADPKAAAPDADPPTRAEVLLSEEIPGPGGERSLYLLHLGLGAEPIARATLPFGEADQGPTTGQLAGSPPTGAPAVVARRASGE